MRRGARVVEERAVVADDEHGAAVVAQPALEPGDGVEVEVVGRLVEQEHVRLLREDDAEPQPPALAARERRDRAREVAGVKPRWLARTATRRSSSSPRARW